MGSWIRTKDGIYQCSRCEHETFFDSEDKKYVLTPFCPYCGAELIGVWSAQKSPLETEKSVRTETKRTLR